MGINICHELNKKELITPDDSLKGGELCRHRLRDKRSRLNKSAKHCAHSIAMRKKTAGQQQNAS